MTRSTRACKLGDAGVMDLIGEPTDFNTSSNESACFKSLSRETIGPRTSILSRARCRLGNFNGRLPARCFARVPLPNGCARRLAGGVGGLTDLIKGLWAIRTVCLLLVLHQACADRLGADCHSLHPAIDNGADLLQVSLELAACDARSPDTDAFGFTTSLNTIAFPRCWPG